MRSSGSPRRQHPAAASPRVRRPRPRAVHPGTGQKAVAVGQHQVEQRGIISGQPLAAGRQLNQRCSPPEAGVARGSRPPSRRGGRRRPDQQHAAELMALLTWRSRSMTAAPVRITGGRSRRGMRSMRSRMISLPRLLHALSQLGALLGREHLAGVEHGLRINALACSLTLCICWRSCSTAAASTMGAARSAGHARATALLAR